MQVLYKHLKEREEFKMRFDAKLHGAKFEDEKVSTFIDPQSGEKVVVDGVLFKDPKEYENMSNEEKEKETQKLMGLTKRWAKGSGLGD